MQNFRFSAVLDGVGLLISLMIRSSFLTVLAAALLLCVGYHLFCNTGNSERCTKRSEMNWLICTEKYLQNEESCAIISPS